MDRIKFREAVLASLPAYADDVAAATGFSLDTVRKRLSDFHDNHEAHIVDWKQALNGTFVPKFAAGQGVDVVRRSYRDLIKDALPGTFDHVVRATKIPHATAFKWLNDLYNKGEAHIVEWNRADNGCFVATYAAGQGVDVPKISPLQIVRDALPGTIDDICAKTKMTKGAVGRWISEIRKTNECRISAWISLNEGGQGAFYELGDAPDVAQASCAQRAYREAVKNALPGYPSDISAATGIGLQTVRHWLSDLHVSEECHIIDWKQLTNHRYVPKYSAGKGADVEFKNHQQIILESLPGHVSVVAKRTKLGKAKVRSLLIDLQKKGEVYVSSWATSESGTGIPTYSRGDRADAKFIPLRKVVKDALPGRSDTIALATGIQLQTVRKWLQDLHKKNQCHIIDWTKLANNRFSPTYALGKGEDVVCSYLIEPTESAKKFASVPTPSEVVFELLPASAISIKAKTNLSKCSIRNALKSMHSGGNIHIVGWDRHSKNSTLMAIFEKGHGIDAPRPIACKKGAYIADPKFIELLCDLLPGSANSIHGKTLCSARAVQHILGVMHDRKEIHVVSWQRAHRKAALMPIYQNGPGEDMPRPVGSPISKKLREQILDAMPGTWEEIRSATQIRISTVRKLVRALNAAKQCHIKEWKRSSNGFYVAYFDRGFGIDAKEKNSQTVILGAMPGTVEQIASVTGLDQDNIRTVILRLHPKNECHIIGVEVSSTGHRVPRYAAGKGVDVEFLDYRDIVKASLPGDIGGIAAATGIKSDTVRKCLLSLHSNKECHIDHWTKRANNKIVATYTLGAGEDALRGLMVKEVDGVKVYVPPCAPRQVILDNLPGTSLGLRASTSLSRHVIGKVLTELRKTKEIYISSWEHNPANRNMLAVFSTGSELDVARPKNVLEQRRPVNADISHYARERIKVAMPGTCEEIHKKTGITTKTVRMRVADLYAAQLCHISGWHPSLNNHLTASYTLGAGVDALPPNHDTVVVNALPGTVEEIKNRTGLSVLKIRDAIKRLRRSKQCHIGAWATCSTGDRTVRYVAGPGIDAEFSRFREIVKSALPGRVDTISAATGVRRSTVRHWLLDLHDKGECHIDSWKKMTNARYIARYAAGPGIDAPCVLAPELKIKGLPASSAPTPKQVILNLLPSSIVQIREKTAYSQETIRANLKALHKEGKTHILKWERHPQTLVGTPVYAIGRGYDMPCTVHPLTAKQKLRRLAEKKARMAREKKAAEEKLVRKEGDWDNAQARKAARDYADRAARHGDPMIMAFFGKTKPVSKKSLLS